MSSPSDVVDIAAIVSEKVCELFPSHTRVGRVLNDGKTIELIIHSGGEPVGCNVDSFWPEDSPLSDERKHTLFWKYHRSMGCNRYAATLATILKQLCDSGVQLTHNGNKVVDILVLNALEFDVSDILSNEKDLLQVRDPVTDITVPSIATHETMDKLLDLGDSICSRLGMRAPNEDRRVKDMFKQHRPESYTGCIPHWWVAVSVEKDSILTGGKCCYMVHLDVCGAAYDTKALVKAPNTNTIVSLQAFHTPHYEMTPNSDENMTHKLLMRSMTSKRDESSVMGGNGRIALQPKSIRHFRCYHKNDTSSIEVTPVVTYLERNQFNDDEGAKISDVVFSILQNVILQLPVGSKVTVCNIKSKPELNGCTGVVYESKKVAGDGRVPIMIKGQKTPLSLKTTCIQLPQTKNRQYETLAEKVNQFNKEMDDYEEKQKAKRSSKQKAKRSSKTSKAQIDAALSDPDVGKALSIIRTGKITFSSYGDAEVKRGVGKILKSPLYTVLGEEIMESLRPGYELSNHPKANEAIKLINLLKAAKQRMMEGVGDMDDVLKVQMSVATRIQKDEQLNFVFDQLQEMGAYVNPASLFR